jgi:hypothetical protein
MEKTFGTQSVSTILGSRIVKSSAIGRTNIEEIKWLTETILTISKQWETQGWGYLVDISHMAPVTNEESEALIKLHILVAQSGCNFLAFVDKKSFMTATQAQQHSKISNTNTEKRHFRKEDEAINWLKERLS